MSVRMMAGLIRGFEQSQDRYTKIQATRDKNRMAQEELDLSKKRLDLKKKEFESKGKMNPMISAMIDAEHAKLKGKKGVLDANLQMSTDAMGKEKQTQNEIKSATQKLVDLIRAGNVNYNANLGTGNVSISPNKPKTGKVDEVKGVIDAGGVYDKDSGEVPQFGNKKEAEDWVQSELHYGWRDKHPEVAEMVEQKYGEAEMDTTVGARAGMKAGARGTVKKFRNNETGQVESFKKVNGKWVKAQ